MQVEVRRAQDRFVTADAGVTSRHSFSFGSHYDPRNVGFGVLVCHNDDLLQPERGYAPHPHRDLEIVTWVLEGELRHDGVGGAASVTPGTVQWLGAGSGVVHSERAGAGRTRFVQSWVRPDEPGLTPDYVHRPAPLGDGWTTVASCGDDAAVRIRSSRAMLRATRLNGEIGLPAAPYLHLFVASGSVVLETGEALDEGDAARISGCEGPRASGTADLLAWAMQ